MIERYIRFIRTLLRYEAQSRPDLGEASGGIDRSEHLSARAIREELRRVLVADHFRRSERSSRFLRAVVEQTLAGRQDEIKEYALGLDVCGRKATFDPRVDPIVRVEASRLRARLDEYYKKEGLSNPIRIDLPLRSYVPVFHQQDPVSLICSRPPETSTARRRILLVSAISLFLFVIGAFLRPASIISAVPHYAARTAPSIAVLPFEDLSPVRGQEGFADGLTGELIDALVHVNNVLVVSRPSILHFKGSKQDVRQIGRELHVGLILQGSVDHSEERVRIVARLIDTSNGYQIWSTNRVRSPSEIFGLQEQIAGSIADELRIRLQR